MELEPGNLYTLKSTYFIYPFPIVSVSKGYLRARREKQKHLFELKLTEQTKIMFIGYCNGSAASGPACIFLYKNSLFYTFFSNVNN
jgi:hypothetical protein